MRYNLLDRTALYKESGELYLVKVVAQHEDDWGIKLSVSVLENRFARENDDDKLEYYSKEVFKPEFTISGAWDIVGLKDDIFHISYVGVRLNFRQSSIEAFKNNETDLYEMWNKRI